MSNLVDVSSVKPSMLRASVGCETANTGCAMVHLFRYHTAALPLHFIWLKVAALLPIALLLSSQHRLRPKALLSSSQLHVLDSNGFDWHETRSVEVKQQQARVTTQHLSRFARNSQAVIS